MKLTREALAVVIGFVLMITLIVSIQQSNDLLAEASEADVEADIDRLRAEFQRVGLQHRRGPRVHRPLPA